MEKKRSFLPLYATNLAGVMNDNFLKTFAGFAAIGWMGSESAASAFMGLVAGLLVLPYIVFSPLADRLTAIFPKRKILLFAKIGEVPIVALAILGFLLESKCHIVASIFLMGLQSSLYSPAKYALVRDIGGEERISTGMGGMEGVSFLGVLAGTVLASFVSDIKGGSTLAYTCLAILATAGLIGSMTIRADERMNRFLHAINPIRYMRRTYRMAKRQKGLNAVIFTLSAFWFVAAMLQMGLLAYGKCAMGLDATHTGFLLVTAAIGIVLGQIVAGFIDRKHFLLGATLITGHLAAAILAIMFFVPLSPAVFGVALGFLAFDMGLFKLPFDAEIQKTVKGPRLNTILAYFNQVSFLFMFAASACYAGVSAIFGPRAFLLLLALVMAVAPLAFVLNHRKTLTFTGRLIFRRRYDVEVDGIDALADAGKTYLVLPNHPAIVDPMLVCTELWRTPLRPLSDELYVDRGGITSIVLKTLDVVRVPDLRKHRSEAGAKIARGLNDVVIGALAEGRSIIFYPSGHIWTEPKEEIGTRQLAYNVAKELLQHGAAGRRNVSIIGVRTLGLWGSIWSRKGRITSPSFLPTFIKSILLWFFYAPFAPRRKVSMHMEDLTRRMQEWTQLTRLEFNRRLESWYNEGEMR